MALHASFITGTSYYPLDFMQPFGDFVTGGVLSSSDLQVTAQGTPNMTVNISGAAQGVNGGNAWIVIGGAGYRFWNDATLNLAITSANASYPRIDLVCAGIDTGTSPYTPTIKVITGTAASSPAVPATPSGFIPLAQVYVAANATSITTANITDVRPYCQIENTQAYNMSASSIDSNGKYTVTTYTRTTGAKYLVSTLSGTMDSNGNYPTMTNVFYQSDGATIDHTDTWTLTYDANGIMTGTSVVKS